MIQKVIIEILGAIFVLLGSYLLAGEYLLGKKIQKLEEHLKNLSNKVSIATQIKGTIKNPPNGIFPTDTWPSYQRRLIVSTIITSLLVLSCVFFVGKALINIVPIYVSLPLSFFSGLIIWFLLYWISLSAEVTIFVLRSCVQIPWWATVALVIFGTIVHLFRGWTFIIAVAIFLRYSFDMAILPLKKIRAFGKEHNLGQLTALIGAILLAFGIVLSLISRYI